MIKMYSIKLFIMIAVIPIIISCNKFEPDNGDSADIINLPSAYAFDFGYVMYTLADNGSLAEVKYPLIKNHDWRLLGKQSMAVRYKYSFTPDNNFFKVINYETAEGQGYDPTSCTDFPLTPAGETKLMTDADICDYKKLGDTVCCDLRVTIADTRIDKTKPAKISSQLQMYNNIDAPYHDNLSVEFLESAVVVDDNITFRAVELNNATNQYYKFDTIVNYDYYISKLKSGIEITEYTIAYDEGFFDYFQISDKSQCKINNDTVYLPIGRYCSILFQYKPMKSGTVAKSFTTTIKGVDIKTGADLIISSDNQTKKLFGSTK